MDVELAGPGVRQLKVGSLLTWRPWCPDFEPSDVHVIIGTHADGTTRTLIPDDCDGKIHPTEWAWTIEDGEPQWRVLV